MHRIYGLIQIFCFLSFAHADILQDSLGYLPWNQERHTMLVARSWEYVDALWDYPSLESPITSEETLLELFEQSTIYVFIYDSLLNKDISRTVLSKESMETSQPAVAFGVRRVFDRMFPFTWRWGLLARSADNGLLNIHEVYEMEHVTNGMIVEVGIEDLKALIKYEKGYDMIPVVVMLWEDAKDDKNQEPEPFIAYAFHAVEEPRNGIQYTSKYVNPPLGYAITSKVGAAQYGDPFLKLWMASTYLADRTTPMVTWEKNPWIDLSH